MFTWDTIPISSICYSMRKVFIRVYILARSTLKHLGIFLRGENRIFICIFLYLYKKQTTGRIRKNKSSYLIWCMWGLTVHKAKGSNEAFQCIDVYTIKIFKMFHYLFLIKIKYAL